MEVAIGANGSTPFQREVREWQRVDPNTGALLSGRLEADRWINGPLNAYGKVVDSQNVSKPNGTQHTQRKQLEVLQARTSSGSLQVVRAQTVQTSSSRWSHKSPRTAQSFEGQRISNGVHLTNGHLPSDGHDQQLTNHHHSSSNSSSNSSSSNRLLTAPSLKLSSLMKSSTATASCGGGSSSSNSSNSPHSITNSMSLVQRHQQQLQFQQKQHQQHQKHESESRSSLSDCTYQPTLGEIRVGGGSGESMETFRNEREMQDSNNLLEHSYTHLPRGKSISTDDLSTEWDQTENGDEPSEWRRVSKIRRSFQFPKSISPKPTTPHPPDLPENTISVSRIRGELENGRRLNTAMRNNHVDLAALDSILNGNLETESKGTKKTSFLTAESLKEIRGKLKKLSDESLYKDDFVMQSDIDNGKDGKSEFCRELNVEQPVILQDSHVVQQSAFQYRPKLENNHTTNSLENRTRCRDTTSSEWHLRRKSYGFEKMTPQDNTIFRSEPSTDSGIGRSGELSNWSPTTESTPRTTIIKFGEHLSPTKTTVTVMNGAERFSPKPLVVQRRYYNKNSDAEEIKRHSIAVDESKYVRDNLRRVFDTKTSIHLNGLYVKSEDSSQMSFIEENGRKQKRVEFCKTEVHFAAESGRVNIVETDGKPPPTNNFRRRRRTSGGSILLDAINSGMPVIHFGDEKKTTFELETAIEETQAMKNNVTISLAVSNDCLESSALSKDDDEDEISLRGILKNKPIKPKPYHLGENIGNNDSLWGVRLRPVAADLLSTKSKTENNEPKKVVEADIKSDLVLEQKPDSSCIKSVAERVRIVEERKDGSGYSTKINLNLSNSPYTWNSPDIDKQHQETIRPIHLRIEEHTTHIPKAHIGCRKFISQSPEIISNGLKSTSLIMKTIKSANQFDEAMKRLHIENVPSEQPLNCTATKLISNMHAITKSSSANSIFQQEQIKSFRPKYSSSLDGDIVLNSEELSDQKVIPSSNFSSSGSSSFILDKYSNDNTSRQMEVLKEEPPCTVADGRVPSSIIPIAAPRFKVIGSSNAVSHQLSQLSRMYDAADFESDDSAKADEEVKLYLGGATGGALAPSFEEKTIESPGSWSRLRVQRSNKKQLQIEGKAEMPQSNVMSIELRSPSSTINKSPQSAVVVPSTLEIPVAQPRSLASVRTTRSMQNEIIENGVYQSDPVRPPQSQKGPLKVVTGGARKLRDHELSYFGVKVNRNNYDEKTKTTQQRVLTNHPAAPTQTNRKVTNNMETSSKWKLPNDKPDLLRHSPDGSTTVTMRPEVEKQKLTNNESPIYENLKKPSSYNRKKDLQRDEMILSEMTKTADQTLKAVSKNSNLHKEHHKRTPQRTTKPLDTIEETISAQLKNQQKTMKSKAVQVCRPGGDVFQRQCCSNRPSSASSTESLSRLSSSGSLRRSRSKSRDSQDKIEYASIKSTKKPATSSRDSTKCKQTKSTVAYDSPRGTGHASSSEDLAKNQRGELPRKIKRSKEKESRVLAENRHRSITRRPSTDSDDKLKINFKAVHDQTRNSRRSTKPEKVDRVSSSKSKAVTATAHDSYHKSRTRSSASGGGGVDGGGGGIITSTSSSTPVWKGRSNKQHQPRK